MNPWISLILGLVLAATGGEMFVKGAVGVSRWLRIPAAVVGSTIAAFATSSAEMAVAVQASLEGTPQLALGNVLGSNAANVGIVFALAVVIAPLTLSRVHYMRDLTCAILAPVITFILILDGSLTRIDAAMLLMLFLIWIVYVIRDSLRERSETASGEAVRNRNQPLSFVFIVTGLAMLVLAGKLIVMAAGGIEDALGLNTFIIGGTLVAFGTITPEVATIIVSRIRGHHDISAGAVLGSNLFNGLLIVSAAGLISPFRVNINEVSVAIGAGILLLVACHPGKSYVLNRSRGFLFFGIYAGYMILLILAGK